MNDKLKEVYDSIKQRITIQPVLVLGPEISVGKGGISYKTYFKKIIKDLASKGAGDTKYFDAENLFSFASQTDRDTVWEKVLSFYKDKEYGDPVLLELISRIHFPLIINVCPDLALNNLLTSKKINHFQASFQSKEVPRPEKDCPVLYNIFGSIESPQTLVLTHGKLYTLIENLLQHNSLAPEIEKYLDEASSFIFLGFKFDSWYYQLICHKLKVRIFEDNDRVNLSTPEYDSNVSGIVMKNHFKIGFTSQNPTQVIESIIDACKDIDGALRNKTDAGSYSAFISYAWKGDDDRPPDTGWKRGVLPDILEKELKGKQTLVQIVRDTKNLDYGDRIDSFMTRIGMGKTVIRIISDKYIKSTYCMIEALRINMYEDETKRIFTVIFDDLVKKKDSYDIDHYKNYWKEKCLELIKDEGALNRNDYANFIAIYRFIEDFFKGIPETKNMVIKPGDIEVKTDGEAAIVAERIAEFVQFIKELREKMKE